MISAILHSLLAGGACLALWWLWRRWFGTADVRVQWIVALGFAARALIGAALFWISFLGLPIARSMQFGAGYWFFGLDGAGYIAHANHALGGGASGALLAIFGHYPSRAFVEVLTLFVAVFGSFASVGLLLNLVAFLVTCALITRLQPQVNGGLLFTLAAIAFGPAALLWSLQPLKDTFFVCVTAALLVLFLRWEERPRVWVAAAVWILVYALATLRWYFALIVCALLALFFVLAALRTPRRLLVSAALFVVLSQAVRFGGGSDVFPMMGRFLDPHTTLDAVRHPQQMTAALDVARRGFEGLHGSTQMTPGRALAKTAPPVPVPPPQRIRLSTPPPPVPPTQRAARLLSGSAAILLPHAIGQRLGLVDVGGGRGLWFFADADTVAFDAVLVFAFVYCVRARRRITPLFVFVLLVLLATGGPLVYTVNNFGTLLRLRGMIYFLAAILPVTLAPASPESARECR